MIINNYTKQIYSNSSSSQINIFSCHSLDVIEASHVNNESLAQPSIKTSVWMGCYHPYDHVFKWFCKESPT